MPVHVDLYDKIVIKTRKKENMEIKEFFLHNFFI